MSTIQLAAVIITLTAGLGFINARFIRLPTTVGLMATALVGATVLLVLDAFGVIDVVPSVRALVEQLDFQNTLLHGMLGLLLFAAALHIDLRELGDEKRAVGLLALGGTLAAAALVGLATFGVTRVLGYHLRLVDALLFGALIAPTDPIAVIGMLRSAGAPRRLEVRIAGESLFNDGIGVVIFTVLLELASGHEASFAGGVGMFAWQALGGGVFGLVSGYVTLQLLESIDDYSIEILLTLMLVVGGYAVAEALGVSAPIAAVVAGLLIGNRGGSAMTKTSRQQLDLFWKLVDDILNAVLFLMIGLVIVIVPLATDVVGAAVLAIPIVLASRWLSVAGALAVSPHLRRVVPHSIKILTWGGLRGGLSIAMALELPPGHVRDLVLVMTYAVVAFSILVQGLTFKHLLRALGVTEA